MPESLQHRVVLTVNVYDKAQLHREALKAYGQDSEEAEAWIGTAENPNITNCLVELWAEHAPCDLGYEFLDY